MGIFICLLLFLPIVIVFIDSALRLFYIVAAKFYKKTTARFGDDNHKRVYYLIVACNEEKVMEKTLTALFRAIKITSTGEVGVICDHCTDNTGNIVNSFMAQAFIRNDGSFGKGPALSWFIEKHANIFADIDIVVILDADTLVEEHFCENVQRAFRPGVDVIQAFVKSTNGHGYPFTTLASFSELLSQYIDDNARAYMNWSVPLRGTGMAFRPQLFCTVCTNLKTQVDDIEISIRLARLGVGVFFDPDTIVFDPKASRMLGLARQRGRWLKGQRQILFEFNNDLWSLFRTGFAEWSLIQALLFKPKTLLIFIKVILFLLAILAPFLSKFLNNLFIMSLLLSFAIDLLYYSYGLNLVSPKKKYLSALLRSPIYLILWIAGWCYSLMPGQRWLRSRRE